MAGAQGGAPDDLQARRGLLAGPLQAGLTALGAWLEHYQRTFVWWLPLTTLPTNVRPFLQVLSPMRKGTAGTSVLNPMLQALLNPPAPGKPELPRHAGGGGGAGAGAFRVGDRVLQVGPHHACVDRLHCVAA